jgi:hypothetical protein
MPYGRPWLEHQLLLEVLTMGGMNWRPLLNISLAILLWTTAGAGFAQEGGDGERSGSVEPVVSFVGVDGDEEKFREDWWIEEGWSAGVNALLLERQLDEETTFMLEGKAVVPENDYRLFVTVRKDDLGFLRAGYTAYRKYFDGTGGFYEPFPITHFEFDDDLHLDVGSVFLTAGIEIPDLPRIGLGYERRFRDGNKSLTGWGGVSAGGITRKIYPTFLDMDETRDIFTAALDHDIGRVGLSNEFRYERYDISTVRSEREVDLDVSTSENVNVNQEYRHDAWANTFRTESHLTERFYLSLGYLASSLDGTADFRMFTVPFDSPFDKEWFTRNVDVDQDSHVVNVSALVGPWRDLTFYGGVQAEQTDKDGVTDAVLREILPGVGIVEPDALIRSSSEKTAFEEKVGFRYRGIPYTTFYAEGVWAQQDIDVFERGVEDADLVLERSTTTDVDRARYMVGFTTSPIPRTGFAVRYLKRYRSNEYDHGVDTEEGYPAFLLDQDIETDEVSTKLTYRLNSRVQATLRYQLASTKIDTTADTDPPSSVQSGEYKENIYSIGLAVTPVARFYLTGTLSYQDVRSQAFDNDVPSVAPYEGDVVAFNGSAAYAFDDLTRAELRYLFSRSRNHEDNAETSLPLLLDNERHAVLASLFRKVRENVELQVRYGFFSYDEDSNSGVDDYRAHLFGAGVRLGF